MSDIDSDEDNIVRYGTQLEPYEEDRSGTVPKPRMSRNECKKLKRLMALNVSYKKAIKICHLPWSEICERMPGIETNVPPQDCSNQRKKLKKKKAKARKRLQQINNIPEVYKPDQKSFWSKTNKKTRHNPSLNRDVDDAAQERIWINEHLMECSPIESRTGQATGDTWDNREQQNSWEPSFSPHDNQRETIPMEYTSHDPHKYTDITNPLHVKVRNGVRVVKRRHSDNESDVRPYLEQPYKVQKTSIGSGEEMYWEPNRPARYGLRNESYPVQHALMDKEPEEILTWGGAFKAQETSVDDGTKVNYLLTPAHAEQIGAHPIEHGPIGNQHNEKLTWGESQVQKTSVKSESEINYWTSPQVLQIGPQNDAHGTNCLNKKPQNAEKSPLNGSANGDPNRHSREGLQNEIHLSIEQNLSDNDSNEIYTWGHPDNIHKIRMKSYTQLDYGDTDRPSRIGLRNQTHPMNPVSGINEFDEDCNRQSYRVPYTLESRKLTGVSGSSLKNNSGQRQNESDEGSSRGETRMTQGTNIKLKTPKPIRVGIQNDTLMSKEQMNLVFRAINQAILKIGVQGAGPRFLRSTQKLGWILMLCEDHRSQKWLEKEIPKLKPWPEAKLSVILRGELPQQILATIFIPSKEDITVKTAIELLRVQNPGLETGRWLVSKVTKVNSGSIVHLFIDNASYKALKLMNYKANLGISKTTFRIKTTSKKLIRNLAVKKKNKFTKISSYSAPEEGGSSSSVEKSPEIKKEPLTSANLKRKRMPILQASKKSAQLPPQTVVNERTNSCGTQTIGMKESKPVVNLIKSPNSSPPSKRYYPKAEEVDMSEWVPW